MNRVDINQCMHSMTKSTRVVKRPEQALKITYGQSISYQQDFIVSVFISCLLAEEN